jgi:CubicO group peptidase (beta-lactamase class C family)
VARFRDFPLSYEPGTLYDYCNSGYVLLGLIIERTSGQSYPQFIDRRIFQPLGMTASGYDDSSSPRADIAAGYSGPGVASGFLNATTLFSAGGLYSTVGDLYRWDQALYDDTLLPDDLRAQMFTPGNGSYGFGWKIERPNGLLRISHAGNMTGVSNFVARYPEQHLTVIVLSNLEFTNAAAISDYAAALMVAR